MTPQWNSKLDGFLQLKVEHLKERHVSAETVREAYSNAPKEALCDLMKDANIKYPKSEKKAGLLAVVERNWDAIIEYNEGMMGCYGVYSTREPPTPSKGTGILFVVKDRVLYPTWTDKLKGFGIIEFKDLGCEINPNLDNGERLEEILDSVSKKALETMLSSVGMVARCSGAETWMTKDRLVGLVKGQWDRIMTKAGYVPLDIRLQLQQATDEQREEEAVARLNSVLQQLPPAQNLPTGSSSAPATAEGFVPFVGRPMKLSVDEPNDEKTVQNDDAGYAMLYRIMNGFPLEPKVATDDDGDEDAIGLPQWYLNDASDFDTKLVSLYEPRGRFLFRLETNANADIDRLKQEISNHITKIAGAETMPCDAFRLEHDGKRMTSPCVLEDYSSEIEMNLVMKLLVRGGGASSKVKKAILKNKFPSGDPYTRDADSKVFEDGFKSALQALKMDTIAVKPFLKTLDKTTFNEVAKLVLNGKEQNDVKIRKLAELTNEGKALLKTIQKTEYALENLRETMEKSIVEQFSGTDGRYMTRLKSLIESIKEGEGADKMDEDL